MNNNMPLRNTNSTYYMTLTLNFFTWLVLVLGIWMAIPSIVSSATQTVLTRYCPMWIMSIIFIISATINIVFKKNFYRFLLFISIPLMFLALLFVQLSVIQGTVAPGAILCVFLAGYSAIYAGEVFKPQKIIKRNTK